ncbi:hypothetical protein C1S86_26310 [Vibrio parahaemolyticus]|nr:hypothetical protein BSR61_24430 [Vibrio parahaemolyticus]PMT73673.1 hypothetical protein C1S97_26445 [Vibrio parahaemolyticus]PMT77820.1 hypothetical protein C1S86_26310 [Vibrio parahaemolyticus]
MILKLSELASQEKTALNDDRLPSVVIGLLSLKLFRSVIIDTQPQHQKQQLITGLVFILEPEKPTAHRITARIWYELGLRVGLVESDGTTVDDDGKLDGKPK